MTSPCATRLVDCGKIKHVASGSSNRAPAKMPPQHLGCCAEPAVAQPSRRPFALFGSLPTPRAPRRGQLDRSRGRRRPRADGRLRHCGYGHLQG